jgi:hypothetical protein
MLHRETFDPFLTTEDSLAKMGELLAALSLRQQFPTKTHISPPATTIDKKNGCCKPFFAIFPLQDNDLAHFVNIKIIVKK